MADFSSRLVSSSSLDLFFLKNLTQEPALPSFLNSRIFLSIDFAPYVLDNYVVLKREKEALFFTSSRREIKKSLGTAVLGRIYLKSRSDIKDIPKLAESLFDDSFF